MFLLVKLNLFFMTSPQIESTSEGDKIDIEGILKYSASDFEDFKITEAACKKINTILLDHKNQSDKGMDTFFRLAVAPGGCKGMQYQFLLDDIQEKGDILLENEGKVIVAIDSISINYIKGSVLDYFESFSESGFKVINPNVQPGGGCGCGKSFAK
jgi:iron-sulfur cluster assembly accessory protein